jgi:hypothetical protein
MLKEFFIKKQLKGMGVEGSQLDAMMKVVKDNPALFQQMGTEIEEMVSKKKMGHQEAALAIAQKYKKELSQIFGKN